MRTALGTDIDHSVLCMLPAECPCLSAFKIADRFSTAGAVQTPLATDAIHAIFRMDFTARCLVAHEIERSFPRANGILAILAEDADHPLFSMDPAEGRRLVTTNIEIRSLCAGVVRATFF